MDDIKNGRVLPTWEIVSYLIRVSRLNDKCKSGLNQVELTNAKYGHMQECGCTVLHQFMFCECLKEIREYKVQSGLEASYLVRGLIFSRSHHPAGRLNAVPALSVTASAYSPRSCNESKTQ